jgi:methyl-accepting chemotaxis protein
MLAIAAVACLSTALTGWLAAAEIARLRYADKEDSTQVVVETGVSLIARYADAASSGEMTTEQAKQSALTAIKNLRYGEDDYFWVHDENLMMLMHPFKPQLDGTDISEIEDPNGVRLFVEMNKVVDADGAGFVEYEWPKPGEEEPQPKISYVAGYEDWGWIIGSGVYVDDVETAIAADRQRLLLIAIITATVLVGVILLVRRSVTRPLSRMSALLEEGDLSRRLPEGHRRTEIDRLSAAINANLDRVRGVVDHVAQASDAVRHEVTQLNNYTDRIETQAGNTAQQAGSATDTSRDMLAGVDKVAKAVAEMDLSIRTISQNAQNVAGVADSAVGIAARTNELVGRLGDSSAEISDVVETITTIAEKTNLLALNATIESSRAGEAGRAFTVVANEVKDLAKATAMATDGIASQVQALQTDASESAAAIAEISKVISEINNYQTGIAAAVEEQASTMTEVSRDLEESSHAGAGTGKVIESVAAATSQTREQLDHIANSVRSLDKISAELQESTAVFAR